jgi:transposase-like protein
MDMRSVNHQVNVRREIISKCRSSGKAVRKWCIENDVKQTQYYYWLRVIRNESLALIPKEAQTDKPTFANIKVSKITQSTTIDNGICAIVKGPNYSVEIINGANSNTLEHTLRILNGLC